MKKERGLIEEQIGSILFTGEYLNMAKDIGFSREFKLNEQIRKQKECIRYLASQLDDLRNKMLNVESGEKLLERIV
ncbi:MAG: hypothetical protein PHQ09_06655 [Actinomycetota bacterium]|nr:hypothetical protein [Actinomycetota bacterium]